MDFDSRIVDIDSDVKDHLHCPDLAGDLFRNMQLVEQSRSDPLKNYMEKASEDHVNPEKRACFVEAIFDGADQIADQVHASPETLHLAVNYLDRYLSRNTIDDNPHLYCVSMTCLVLALKYEEVEEASFNFNRVTSIGPSFDDFV
ncbi:hypothetical protein CASFOL_008448 [Castilleja foliolosa]|uniref:Cyclin N-terminal domain-containing protein n=1 Tax=Castilleja foliolosa TaxID=1961234 RepID=A0ABD3DZ06_9LAMI